MHTNYIVTLVLSVSVAALGLLAAYQQHQIQRLRAFLSQLLRTYMNERKEPHEK